MYQKILNFFANSSLMIAVTIASIVYSSSVILGIDTKPEIYVAVFLLFFSVYSMNKLIEVRKDFGHGDRVRLIKKYFKPILWASVISYAVGVLLIAKDRLDLVPFSLIPLLFVVFYTFKLMPKRFKFRRIKDIPVGKNVGAALVVMCFGALLPSFLSSGFTYVALFVVSVFIFARFLINTIVFDLPDHGEDRRNGVKTIPVMIGSGATKMILFLLNASLGTFLSVAAFLGWVSPIAHFANISTLYTFFYLYLLDRMPRHRRMITDMVVDGEYLAMALFVFAGTLILA